MPERLEIRAGTAEDELEFIGVQLDRDNARATRGRMHFPGAEEPGLAVRLVVKDPEGAVAGGIETSSVLGVMWLRVLWVADEARRQGLGGWLVLEAERIAHEKGCIGAGTWTFNWQGAEFYPTIGYELRGIYTGYPFGVTEHVLAKRLPDLESAAKSTERIARLRREGFVLVTEPSQAERRTVGRGLHESCVRHAGEEMDHPQLAARLVLKDESGAVVGGLDAFATIRNLILEAIWVDERYRREGYGRRLLLEAERIAREAGCTAVSTHCLSFQAPGFFHALGYTTYGVVDVAIDGHMEHLLMKRL